MPDELFTLEEYIKHKTSIGENVALGSMCPLYAACIRLVGLAHLRIANIVIRAISRTI